MGREDFTWGVLMPLDFTMPTQFHGILSTIAPLDILDILIVAVILYRVYVMLEDTRAITLAKGILVLLGVTVVASYFNLHVISWLLQKSVTLLFVALPIVFQPELRRALEHLGQGRFFRAGGLMDDEEAQSTVREIRNSVKILSANKIGALLVIERNMGLNDISATGIQIDGLITSDFLMNVFIPNTPLHDGAAIIRGNRLIAAGASCRSRRIVGSRRNWEPGIVRRSVSPSSATRSLSLSARRRGRFRLRRMGGFIAIWTEMS